MSDDIVIRLKNMNGSLTDMEWLTVIEAAYEIERLRRDLEKHGGPLSFSGYRGARAYDISLANEVRGE